MADPQILDEPLPGVYVLDCPHYQDHRGDFTKVFHAEALLAQGISFTPAESFSDRGGCAPQACGLSQRTRAGCGGRCAA